MKHKAIRLILFTTSALLVISALYCLLLLMARVDTTEEFLSKRSAAYWHVFIWPVALWLFKLSRPRKDTSASTTWLSQNLGERGAAIIETALLIFLVTGAAWFISASAMQGEYGRMAQPEKYHDWLYSITGI